jgi:hypothetical protein
MFVTRLEKRLAREKQPHPRIRNERKHQILELDDDGQGAPVIQHPDGHIIVVKKKVSVVAYRGGWELRCPGPDCDKVIGYRHDRPPPTYGHGWLCTPCAEAENAELLDLRNRYGLEIKAPIRAKPLTIIQDPIIIGPDLDQSMWKKVDLFLVKKLGVNEVVLGADRHYWQKRGVIMKDIRIS